MTYRRNPQANPAADERLDATHAEARRRVSASTNRQFFIGAGVNAPVAAEPEAKVFPLRGYIKVDKATALRFVDDVWDGRFRTEALVPLHITQGCFFIG